MKPILFNGVMVRAIIEGTKTQTRRVLKPANPFCRRLDEYGQGTYGLWVNEEYVKDYSVSPCWLPRRNYIAKYAPYKPGDVLYVRETWQYTDASINEEPGYVYRATDPDWETMEGWKWRPSIHMPKEAARIFLVVKDVRLDRLHALTTDECLKEGVPDGMEAFARLWDSTIKGKDLSIYGWAADPWVWAFTFERISKEDASAVEVKK